MKRIKGGLYIVPEVKWQESLSNLEYGSVLARFTVSPGFFLGRPAWPDTEARERWLRSTGAVPVEESELNGATRKLIARHDLM